MWESRCLFGVAGFNRRNFSQRKEKKEALGVCLGNSAGAAADASCTPNNNRQGGCAPAVVAECIHSPGQHPCPAGPTGSLRGKQRCPSEESCSTLLWGASGSQQSPERLNSVGVLNYPKGLWESLAARTARREKVVCELLRIGAPQGQHNWWTEGIGWMQKGTGGPGSEMRNWAGAEQLQRV